MDKLIGIQTEICDVDGAMYVRVWWRRKLEAKVGNTSALRFLSARETKEEEQYTGGEEGG